MKNVHRRKSLSTPFAWVKNLININLNDASKKTSRKQLELFIVDSFSFFDIELD